MCFTPPALLTHFSTVPMQSAVCTTPVVVVGEAQRHSGQRCNLTALQLHVSATTKLAHTPPLVPALTGGQCTALSCYCSIFTSKASIQIECHRYCQYFAWRLPFDTAPASNYLLAGCRPIHLHLLQFLACIPIISRANIVGDHVKNRNSYIFACWVLISQYCFGGLEASAGPSCHLALITRPIPILHLDKSMFKCSRSL